MQCRLCFFKREVFSIWCDALHFWRFWSGDQDDHQGQKEVQPWDTFPKPTDLRLVGYLTEATWTQKSKSSMLTPKTNSLTFWPKEVSHVMNGIIFSVCPIWAFFSSASCPEAMPKRMQQETGEERSEIEADDESGVKDCGKVSDGTGFECI